MNQLGMDHTKLTNWKDDIIISYKKTKDFNTAIDQIRSWNEHTIGIDKLCEKFETDKITGLTEEEAKCRLNIVGENVFAKEGIEEV